MALSDELRALEPRLIEWRRHLHMNPELSFEEQQTSAFIAQQLTDAGIPFSNPVGTSLVATIDGENAGPTVALRADIDALPLHEENEVPYRSRRDGVMHACGHDGHVAMLLGAGLFLSRARNFSGRVVLIFQSAEEKPPGGAKPLIESGALDGVGHVFGLHLRASQPTGWAGIRSGAVTANTDLFDAQILGRGGHAGWPHLAVNAGVVAAQCVVNLQSILPRRVSPLEAAVISVGYSHAGSVFNIIPGEANFGGTVRTLSASVRDSCEAEIAKVVADTCQMMGASCRFRYERGYPSVENHAHETALLRSAIQDTLGRAAAEIEPTMGGEDFAYYVQKAPGAFLFLGAGGATAAGRPPHHNSRFDFDEASLILGTEIMIRAARSVVGVTPSGKV